MKGKAERNAIEKGIVQPKERERKGVGEKGDCNCLTKFTPVMYSAEIIWGGFNILHKTLISIFFCIFLIKRD